MSKLKVRYEPGRYRDCRWCQGSGCVACEGEALKDYKRAFPEGPEPLATFDRNNPEEMEMCRDVFGGESLQHAFGPEGGGVTELTEKLRKAVEARKEPT